MAKDLWHRTHRTEPKFDKTDWTEAMTKVLVDATTVTLSSIAPNNWYVSGKGHCNPYGRSEYFNLDVIGLDNESWVAPFVIIEHENDTDVAKIEHCAWKLMCIEAQLRVLVAYVDQTGEYSAFPSPDKLAVRLRPIVEEHPGKELALIAGQLMSQVQNNDWSSVFSQPVLLPR
jgi:hypothetical protein